MASGTAHGIQAFAGRHRPGEDAMFVRLLPLVMLLAGCASTAPTTTETRTATRPKEYRTMSPGLERLPTQRCRCNADCFGGHGTCHRGTCSVVDTRIALGKKR
jgi:hypothetical protein